MVIMTLQQIMLWRMQFVMLQSISPAFLLDMVQDRCSAFLLNWAKDDIAQSKRKRRGVGGCYYVTSILTGTLL